MDRGLRNLEIVIIEQRAEDSIELSTLKLGMAA